MTSLIVEKNKKNEQLVNILSISIPVAVAILIGIRTKNLGSVGELSAFLKHLES